MFLLILLPQVRPLTCLFEHIGATAPSDWVLVAMAPIHKLESQFQVTVYRERIAIRCSNFASSQRRLGTPEPVARLQQPPPTPRKPPKLQASQSKCRILTAISNLRRVAIIR